MLTGSGEHEQMLTTPGPRCARCWTLYSVRGQRPTDWRFDNDINAESVVDMPMSRVKFNVNTEYSYLQNFKILTSACLSASVWCRDLHSLATQT